MTWRACAVLVSLSCLESASGGMMGGCGLIWSSRGHEAEERAPRKRTRLAFAPDLAAPPSPYPTPFMSMFVSIIIL